MRILFINNLGGGFCDPIEIAEGTTIRGLFEQRVPHGKPDDFLVRVNRQPCAADQVLHDGDRVSITPVKIEGGRVSHATRSSNEAGRSTFGSAASSASLDNDLLRIARRVHEHLDRPHRPEPMAPLPSPLWKECERLERQITRATNRGWVAAAARLRRRLLGRIADLQYRLGDTHRELERLGRATPRPTLASVYADLVALRDEFSSTAVRYDHRSSKIAVATEPIVLGDWDLGPFEIVLRLANLRGEPAYDVVALAPRPSVARESVTHPHVDSERLCEGEGRAAIGQALEEGRLLDFFLVVASILRTYNPESAYVTLADWDGVECHDCGLVVSPEDRDVCSSCRDDLCENCCTSCLDCGFALCASCSTECRRCGDLYCGDCLRQCTVCRDSVCQECLDDEGICEDCREEEEPEQDENPDAAADAVRLGQAAVPA